MKEFLANNRDIHEYTEFLEVIFLSFVASDEFAGADQDKREDYVTIYKELKEALSE